MPEECRWDRLRTLAGEALERRFNKDALEDLSQNDDIVGTLFLKAESKINDPAKLNVWSP